MERIFGLGEIEAVLGSDRGIGDRNRGETSRGGAEEYRWKGIKLDHEVVNAMVRGWLASQQ